MSKGVIDNEETIRKLVKLTEEPRYIELTRKALSKDNIDEDDVLFITAMSIGEALKKIIPERQYKRLIIKVWPEDTEDENKSLGSTYEENGKHIVNYYHLNRSMLMRDDVDFVDKLQCFFTFAHELYHVKQALDAKYENITFDSFLYCLESGLMENVPGFYKKEYDNLYMETAAEGIGIIMATEFLEKYGTLKKENMSQFSKLLIKRYKPNHHIFAQDEELKEYIKRLLKILRENIHTFSKKIDEDMFVKYPMLKYLISPRTGELVTPERLQQILDNTDRMEDSIDTRQRRELLKILKELSIERQQSNSHK